METTSSSSHATAETPAWLGRFEDGNQQLVSALTMAMQAQFQDMGQLFQTQCLGMTSAVNNLTQVMNATGKAGPSTDNSVDEEAPLFDDPVSMHEDDRSLDEDGDTMSASAFLDRTNPEEPDDNSEHLSSALNDFLKDYESAEEKFGPAVSEKIQQTLDMAFKSKMTDDKLKKLLSTVLVPKNCKSTISKRINPILFSAAPPPARSSDIKLSEVQRDIAKGVACLTSLLAQLPEVLKDTKSPASHSIIQNVLNGISILGHGSQGLTKIRKSNFLNNINPDYKDIGKYAADNEEYLFGEEVGDSLKKAKDLHTNVAALRKRKDPPPSTSFSSKSKFQKYPKNGQGSSKTQGSRNYGQFKNNQSSHPYQRNKAPYVKKPFHPKKNE